MVQPGSLVLIANEDHECGVFLWGTKYWFYDSENPDIPTVYNANDKSDKENLIWAIYFAMDYDPNEYGLLSLQAFWNFSFFAGSLSTLIIQCKKS